MAKDIKGQQKTSQGQSSPKLTVRVEYVGIIAVAFLIIGVIVGSQMGGASRKITVDTAHTNQTAMNTAVPDEATIRHLMEQIGNTTNLKALVHMGNQAMDQHMTAVAIAAYEKALKINPDDPNVITDLGAVYNDQAGDSKKALALFQRAAKLDPKHVQSRFNIGIAARALHEHELSRKAFQEVINLDPKSQQAEEARKLLEQPDH